MADRLNLAVLVDASARFAGSDEALGRLLKVLREADVAPGIAGMNDTALERWVVDDTLASEPETVGWSCFRPAAGAVAAVHLLPSLASRPRVESIDQTHTLILPYAHDLSDRAQASPPGWTPDEWLQYLMDGFDRLDEEAQEAYGVAVAPGLLILLLHPQFSGRAGAVQALQQFLRYVGERDGVGWCSPLELAAEVRACL